MTPRRMSFSRDVCVLTTMPGATGVVHDEGVPARPSISTRQRRQEPKASTMSVAQSFGMAIPASMEARMIDVPSGTVTVKPSTVSVTCFPAFEAGVPKSISWMRPIRVLLKRQRAPSPLRGGWPRSGRVGSFRQCATHP